MCADLASHAQVQLPSPTPRERTPSHQVALGTPSTGASGKLPPTVGQLDGPDLRSSSGECPQAWTPWSLALGLVLLLGAPQEQGEVPPPHSLSGPSTEGHHGSPTIPYFPAPASHVPALRSHCEMTRSQKTDISCWGQEVSVGKPSPTLDWGHDPQTHRQGLPVHCPGQVPPGTQLVLRLGSLTEAQGGAMARVQVTPCSCTHRLPGLGSNLVRTSASLSVNWQVGDITSSVPSRACVS